MTDPLVSRFVSVDAIIEQSGFSGVVSVARGGHLLFARAAGFADRAHAIPNTLETRFAIASGTKGLTALVVMSLVADGIVDLDGSARELLGEAGSLVEPGVTVRQLLAHTSGVGDYVDEATITDIEDYVLDVPVHQLESPADYRVVLSGRAPLFAPGQGFAYSSSGYVLLALLIEALAKRSYYDVVHERVCAPAGLRATEFLRLDELPGTAAIGYLPGRNHRTHHLHLPVRGAGDGGGFEPASGLSVSVLSNTTTGAWPVARELVKLL